ncbi:hypothetical protein Noda2021_08530 [Candidatus Dependentiae bacterium Noda2021]|nr:hypothetical protein Noda2021_08530 [Candidatus Dependentiae bacterium Noda2021]
MFAMENSSSEHDLSEELEINDFYFEVPQFSIKEVTNATDIPLLVSQDDATENIGPQSKKSIDFPITLQKKNGQWYGTVKLSLNKNKLYVLIKHSKNHNFFNTRILLGRKTMLGTWHTIRAVESKNYQNIYPKYSIRLKTEEDLETSKITVEPEARKIKSHFKDLRK